MTTGQEITLWLQERENQPDFPNEQDFAFLDEQDYDSLDNFSQEKRHQILEKVLRILIKKKQPKIKS